MAFEFIITDSIGDTGEGDDPFHFLRRGTCETRYSISSNYINNMSSSTVKAFSKKLSIQSGSFPILCTW